MTQPVQQPQIPQLTPEEGKREATPAEIRQLQDAIYRVRKVIARFHDTRRRNNERMAGLRAAKLWPQQVQQIVHATRQPEVEAQAVEQLRQFLRVLRGHEPTRQEMQEGIPEGLEQQMGMGGLPFAVAAVAVSLATSVYSIFSFLDNSEERISRATATPLDNGLRALSSNIWGVAAISAVAGGVYIYHKSQVASEASRRRGARLSEEESEEDPSLLGKAKSFVRNGLFPAQRAEADKLSAQYETMSDEEKDRFIDIINGDTDDEEPEEPEEIEEIEENEEEEEECTSCPGDSEEEPEEPEESEEEPEVEENPDDSEEEPLEENEEDEEEQDEPEEK